MIHAARVLSEDSPAVPAAQRWRWSRDGSRSAMRLVLQRRFLNLVSFWPETASRRAKVTKSVAS